MLFYNLFIVLMCFAWGLWFLSVPGGKKERIGLTVGNIMICAIISVIPIFNLIATVLCFLVVIVGWFTEGVDVMFPNSKIAKTIDNFLKHDLLSKKSS